ncbi:MAG: efflux RND transporter periplasmic adaptor subunit [Candidatus Binatus sp.]
MSGLKSGVVNALALAALCAIVGCRSHPTGAVAIPDVTVARPGVQNVTDYLTFTGNTASADSVQLVARVEGYLEKLHFTDGALVKKGDVLFTIQQQPYQAQLVQANAQLAAQRAALWHAQTEFKRYGHLLTEDAATQTEVDHWRFEKISAEAGVRGALGQVSIAELNLSYTTVTAPFDGRLGRHLVDPGNVVGAMGQQTKLAEVDRIDPLYVYFTIDERDLLRVAARRRAATRQRITRQPLPISYGVTNEEGFPHSGLLDFASLTVEPTTGTLQLRATIPNRDLSLLPGLFVRIRVPTAERRGALVVPGDAVSFDQQGEYVLIVNDKNIVERRGVKSGSQIGDALVIEDGLKPDDWVIVEGRLEAIPGREVKPTRLETPIKSAPAGG